MATEARRQKGLAFLHSAASFFSTAVYQGEEAYNNAQGKPDIENSDGVQNAWKLATQAAQERGELAHRLDVDHDRHGRVLALGGSPSPSCASAAAPC
jgi:hypothetical protein